MRRTLLVAIIATAFIVLTAGQALAGHCVNPTRSPDAGTVDVVIDATTGEVVSQPNGGFADLYLDTDGDGAGDVLLAEDVMIGRNHSPQYDEADAWVNPGAAQKADNPNATDDYGVILPHSP